MIGAFSENQRKLLIWRKWHIGVILGSCTRYVLLYFSKICLKYFSQCNATIGILFLSRNKKPVYPSIIGSTKGAFLLVIISMEHRQLYPYTL